MPFLLVGFGLLLHFFFWGAGLALLVTPRRWKAAWPALAAPAGVALQSAVVWFGAHLDLPGAQSYGRIALAIPVVLLGAGTWRSARKGWRLGFALWQWRGVALLTGLILTVLLLPFAHASKVLTTSSLGSCDAADYAAGARTLLEFAKSDRSGFLGLTEVVSLNSVDSFFGHWLRLNHFTPSALLALNAAILELPPHALVSTMTAVFVALSLPVVFWVCRRSFRYGPGISFVVTGLYGLSPLVWYAVYHVAMSQLLAAVAIALLNAIGLDAWATRSGQKPGGAWFGLLAVTYWIVMGAYNFIIIVALVPAVAVVGIETLRRAHWRKVLSWCFWMLLPLAPVALLFTQRTLGLIERFVLFQQTDFGWAIPGAGPEGWLGLVSDPSLQPWSGSLRWIALAAVLALLGAALLRRPWARTNRLLVIAAMPPVLLGYGFLLLRGHLRGTNASYDAYKLLCVFLPLLLPAMLYWLTFSIGPRVVFRAAACALLVLVVAGNGIVARQFSERMRNPPLLVGPGLIALQGIESDLEVASLNLRISDFWSRLWANHFLLRRAQYFEIHTYEGRRNTPLRGDWDLNGDVIRVSQAARPTPACETIAAPYSLVDTRRPDFVRARIGAGWYQLEQIARREEFWRWCGGEGVIVVDNPQSHAVTASLQLSLRGMVPQAVRIRVGEETVGHVAVGLERGRHVVSGLRLRPGENRVSLSSDQAPVPAGPADGRLLAFAAYDVDVVLQPSPLAGTESTR